MGICPFVNKTYRQELFVEAFAVSIHFALLQAFSAKVVNLPCRTPLILGFTIPLSHYSISYLEHQSYPHDTVHTPKHNLERQLVITSLTFLIIRSTKQTPHEIPYTWGCITLIAARIGTTLTLKGENHG